MERAAANMADVEWAVAATGTRNEAEMAVEVERAATERAAERADMERVAEKVDAKKAVGERVAEKADVERAAAAADTQDKVKKHAAKDITPAAGTQDDVEMAMVADTQDEDEEMPVAEKADVERVADAATQDEVERATAAGSGICRDLSELGYCDCDCFHIRVTRTHCGLFCDLYWKGLWVFPPVTHVSSSLYLCGGSKFPQVCWGVVPGRVFARVGHQ